MKTKLIVAAITALLLVPFPARAHCDAMDGPVITTARAALDRGDVAPVLAWVKPEGEQHVRSAFQQAVAARKKAPAAREASDHRFFETLVRVHRAGEGAEYTGLKPAGAGMTPAIRAADAAVEARDGGHVEQLLTEEIRGGLRERFEKLSAREPPGKDVAAGREWVDAYVSYIHYVEGLEAAAHAGGHDEHRTAAPAQHDEHSARGEHAHR
jgi:hypothetical protein